MKIIFAGTSDVAQAILRYLVDHQLEISHVYTQPDRPAGRGRHLTPSPVKTEALACGIPVFQPTSLKTSDQLALLRDLAPDLLVVVAYGMLLPEAILQIPRYGCINVHFSLLPRWRGASCVQQAILEGDSQTGVSIIQMDKGLDTGPILASQACDILSHDTSEDLFNRLVPIAQTLLLKTIHELPLGTLRLHPQISSEHTYAPLIEKHDARIDWSKSAIAISRSIRAFYPWPVAYTQLRDQFIRIFNAQIVDEVTQEKPGLLLAAHRDGLDVATGLGILRITQVQLPGKRRLSVRDLMNAQQAQWVPGIIFQ